MTFWLDWNNQEMLRYIMALNSEPPRQTPPKWKEWKRLRLPDEDLTFIQQALWRTLPMGTRLAGWQPQGTACPLACALGGQQETVAHSLLHCRFLVSLNDRFKTFAEGLLVALFPGLFPPGVQQCPRGVGRRLAHG